MKGKKKTFLFGAMTAHDHPEGTDSESWVSLQPLFIILILIIDLLEVWLQNNVDLALMELYITLFLLVYLY